MIKRSAFTLTELIITMAAGSTLMIMAIGMIHQTMTLASASRARADSQRSMNRLAEQFRHDVHRAEQITVESPELIRIALAGDQNITYEATDHDVIRRQLVAAGQHREIYQLATDTKANFASEREPRRAVITVLRETGLNGIEPRIDRHVAAVVGHLQRHESGEVASP